MEKQIGSADNYLDFNDIEYGSTEFRNNLKNRAFQFASFSKSNFYNCNLTNVIFKNCDFTRCDFSEVRQWNCLYENCKFINTKFYNTTMGVEVSYIDCQFVKSKLTGKYFQFGRKSEFDKCTFENCDIKSAWILSTVFKKCSFSSKLINVRFSGQKEAEVSSTPSQPEFPATFVGCDFSKSVFEDLEIMDGAILTDTVLPNQHNERFNNDRIYYPKL